MSVKNKYTKEMLIEQLEQMGLKKHDAIMIHSSMKAIGDVEGGADTVVDAWMSYFSDGLLMTPTHTWKQMSKEYRIFDPKNEPACVGILPNIFRTREGVVRSLHPTHSIAAFGKQAEEYIKGDELANTPCPPTGCFGRLRDIHAKILLIGVTHVRNTYIHSVEESFDVPERFTAEQYPFQVKMPDGTLKDVPMYRHDNPVNPHISEEYDKLMKGFYDTGVTTKGKFGDAECILCDVQKLYEVTGRVLAHEKNCLIERESIPDEWFVL